MSAQFNDQLIAQQQNCINIIRKIHEIVELEPICQLITTKLITLLKVDGVFVYEFSGKCWASSGILTHELVDLFDSLPESLNEIEGVSANADYLGSLILSEDLNDGIEIGKQITKLIVPIASKEGKWGILGIYHSSYPRYWQPEETNWVQQVAFHLSIALEHHKIYQQQQKQRQILDKAVETAIKRQTTIAKIIDNIRCSVDINTILNTATEETRKLFKCDRVGVYRFNEDYSGEFIAESVGEGWRSLVKKQLEKVDNTKNIKDCTINLFNNLELSDTYLQQTQGGRFKENKSCIIDDIQQDNRFSDCDLRILESFGVRASAIVPLFQGTQLWGLLVGFEHNHPRQWQNDEIDLLKRIAHHLSVALQQNCHIRQIQEYGQEQAMMVQQERALSEVIDKIRRTLDLDTIFQTAVTEVRNLLKADRVAIFKFDPDSQFALAKLISEDVTTKYPSALQEKVEDHCFAKYSRPYYEQGHVFTINDLSQADLLDCHREILERFQVKANMVAPLFIGEELWGLICIHQCSYSRQWKPLEKGFITKIATHLSVAIQQAALLKDTQQRAKILEKTLKQVQVQKQHLAEVAEQEKALARVIERIRQSLDLESIFASTTEEVREILNCDRVVVYRFWENWGGEFLYESLAPGWKPLRDNPTEDPLWEDTYLQKTQGGRYRNHEVFWVSDINRAELTPCHRKLLQQFQVKAFLTVPVFVGEKLWGILGVYDNQKPRYWYKREIDLLEQVGNQLGVAVYQSELLRKTQQHSEILETTLADLNTVVDNLGDGLLVVDIYGKITRYNPNLLSMFDIVPPLLGKQVLDIFPDELSPLLKRKKLDKNKPVTVEISLSNSRIGQALASNIIKKQPESEEECLGFIILIRDITKEREMEKTKRNVLSMVSHEIRTPLTSIVGFSSLIRDKLYNVIFSEMPKNDRKINKAMERIKENLDIVILEAERLAKLVNDFLDMTKIESGKITLNLFPVKPSIILSWSIASTSHLFEASSVELVEDFSEDLPTILGDEDRLIQVFVNLISNGFKFTETGSVSCKAEIDHDNLLISITDTGVGISENDYSKVFEPFQQLGSILTNKPKGTGLGLSISKQIIEQHGGEIWFNSKLGKGSTFFVSLPLALEN